MTPDVTCLHFLGVELNIHHPGKKVSRGLGSVMAVKCVLLETGVKAGRSLRVLTSGDNVMVNVYYNILHNSIPEFFSVSLPVSFLPFSSETKC